jgi:C4-dicarboxylate transporter DctM subunit
VTLALILLLSFLFLLLGFPLFLLLAGVTLLGYAFFTEVPSDQWGFVIAQKMTGVLSKDALLAIPLFIFAGVLMTLGGISQRIVAFAQSLLGFLPGGLAIATVFACMVFAAISGSSPATLVAIGLLMFPALKEHRYPERFSLGLLTTAGSLGIIIPPSVPMIVYAISVEKVSVGNLFLAGFLPGIFLGILLMVYCFFRGITLKIPLERFQISRVFQTFREGVLAILLPVLVLGSIYSGIFTVNEAAAFSAVYALLLSTLIYRELRIRDLPRVLIQALAEMGSVLIIVAMAQALAYFFTVQQTPQKITELLQGFVHSRFGFLILVNIVLLMTGALMDSISAILVLAPILARAGQEYGIDPVHLGIITIVNLEIGYFTPPVGINLFVSSAIFSSPFGRVITSVIPFLFVFLFGLVVITYFPPLSLTLVKLWGNPPGGVGVP